jgi:hypothetical protein
MQKLGPCILDITVNLLTVISTMCMAPTSHAHVQLTYSADWKHSSKFAAVSTYKTQNQFTTSAATAYRPK